MNKSITAGVVVMMAGAGLAVVMPAAARADANTGALQICVHGDSAAIAADGPQQLSSDGPIADGNCVMYSGDSAVAVGRYTIRATESRSGATDEAHSTDWCTSMWKDETCHDGGGDTGGRAAEIIVYRKTNDAGGATRRIVRASSVTVDVDTSTPAHQRGTRVDFIFES